MVPSPPRPDPAPGRAPPRRAGGPLAWLRRNLFATPASTLATLLVGAGLARVLPAVIRWLFTGAVYRPDYAACRGLEYRAACWGFVAAEHRLILFGRYPYGEQWRPLVATLLVVGALGLSAHPRSWRRWLLPLWALVLAAFLGLLHGGVLGLSLVDPGLWGGLPLTVILTLIGVGASIPLGIVLALGRRS